MVCKRIFVFVEIIKITYFIANTSIELDNRSENCPIDLIRALSFLA